jgi:hypothetical protein
VELTVGNEGEFSGRKKTIIGQLKPGFAED